MAPAPLRSSGPGQALSGLNTARAEMLRGRAAAAARGDELSAQGWQHHPCASWPGVLAHGKLSQQKGKAKPLGATAAGSQRGGECSSLDVFYKGPSTQRAAGDPLEIRRDLHAPEEPTPGQEFLEWLQAAHAGAGTALKKEQQEDLLHKSPRLPCCPRACHSILTN